MRYDTAFYEAETCVAMESARCVIPWVIQRTGATSVIDIGCGTGAWAKEAETYGCDVKGVDFGVPQSLRLLRAYVDHDLTNGYPCEGWDLAICVEVAEHLPPESAVPLVAGLAQAKHVLFSAATPGQPGVGHINCQPHGYWHDLFFAWGFTPSFVGGLFTEPVADFYRRNLYLYSKET